MTITVNILYQGKGENARLFAGEMVSSGLVDKIRQQSGNLRYEYFVPLDNQHAILLREKYQLRLKVTRYQQID